MLSAAFAFAPGILLGAPRCTTLQWGLRSRDARRKGSPMFRTIITLLLIFPMPAVAQIVRGTVKDPAAEAAVNAVTIRLLGPNDRVLAKTMSDAEGKFALVLPRDQRVRISAERVGYETVASEEFVARAGDVLEVEVVMARQAIEVEGVTVVARRRVEPRLREFELRAATYGKSGMGRIWTREYFEQYRSPLVSHFMRMLPVREDMMCAGVGYYVDRVPTEGEDIDMVLSPDDIEGLEMYRHTQSPPDVRPYFFRKEPPFEVPYCTVVMIWRRPYTELYARTRPVSAWHIVAVLGAIAGLVTAQEMLF